MREPANNTRTPSMDNDRHLPNHLTMFTLLPELNIICGQWLIQFELQYSLSRAFAIDGKIYPSLHCHDFTVIPKRRAEMTPLQCREGTVLHGSKYKAKIDFVLRTIVLRTKTRFVN